MKPSASRDLFPRRPPSFGAGFVPIGSPIVAHQGGWDEILMVVAPLAIIGGLLWLANRRVTAQLESELSGRPVNGETGTGDTHRAADSTDIGPRSPGDDGQD